MGSVKKDKNQLILEQLANKDKFVCEFGEIFASLDSNGVGEIYLEDLEIQLENPLVVSYFETLDLEVAEAWDIFKLLDVDLNGSVSIEEFVSGCLRLRGYAKTIDVWEVRYDIGHLYRKVSR